MAKNVQPTDLHDLYEKETGQKPYTGSLAMGHWQFTDSYVEWLEKQLTSGDTNA